MNTINPMNNISFGARYVDVNSLQKVPPRISSAILKSEAIDEFLKKGEPKTFWGKLIDFLKKDELLEVNYNKSKPNGSIDPYAQDEILRFSFKKADKAKSVELKAEQKGIRRRAGSIPKPNENPLFKAPVETAEDKLVAQIEKINDFEKLLK